MGSEEAESDNIEMAAAELVANMKAESVSTVELAQVDDSAVWEITVRKLDVLDETQQSIG